MPNYELLQQYYFMQPTLLLPYFKVLFLFSFEATKSYAKILNYPTNSPYPPTTVLVSISDSPSPLLPHYLLDHNFFGLIYLVTGASFSQMFTCVFSQSAKASKNPKSPISCALSKCIYNFWETSSLVTVSYPYFYSYSFLKVFE
jgi:hypothetical protein